MTVFTKEVTWKGHNYMIIPLGYANWGEKDTLMISFKEYEEAKKKYQQFVKDKEGPRRKQKDYSNIDMTSFSSF